MRLLAILSAAALSGAAPAEPAFAGPAARPSITLDHAYGEIQRVFRSLDSDADGRILTSQLPRYWENARGTGWALQLVDPIRWHRSDRDRDGWIVFEDVIGLYRAKIEDLDRNGDQILTHREWQESGAEEERYACVRGDCQAVFAKAQELEASRRRNGRAFARLDPDLRAAFRFNSGITQPTYMAIRDYKSWHLLWDRMVAPHGPRHPSPGIDFSREMVLVAAMGARPTGGYRVQILSVHETPAALVATVVRTSPGRRCGTTQGVTEPVDVIRMASSPKAVRWVFRDQTSECP